MAEEAVVAAQPERAVLVDLRPDLGGLGVVAVGREPLLLVALVARLEVLPLLQVAVSIQAGRKPAPTARSTRLARSPNSAADVPGHMPASSASVGVRCQNPSPSSTRPPGVTSRRSSRSAAAVCPGGWTSVSAWLAPRHSTRSAGPRVVPTADSRANVTRSSSPRALGVVPAPGQVALVRVEAEPGRVRRRRENAEHQLAPPAADVEHGAGMVPGEPGDKPGGPGLGQGPVKGQLSQVSAGSSVSVIWAAR